MRKQAKIWLSFAETDLLTAEKLLNDERLTQSVAFHCHQAIEKSFKAILENKMINIPRIHDLIRLYNLIEESGIELDIEKDLLLQVNDVYIDSRYPADTGLIPQGKPSVQKGKEFYNLAKEIYLITTSLLSENKD